MVQHRSIPLSTIWKEMCNCHIDADDINCDPVAGCQHLRPSGTEFSLFCSEGIVQTTSHTTLLSANGEIHSLAFTPPSILFSWR